MYRVLAFDVGIELVDIVGDIIMVEYMRQFRHHCEAGPLLCCHRPSAAVRTTNHRSFILCGLVALNLGPQNKIHKRLQKFVGQWPHVTGHILPQVSPQVSFSRRT